MILLQTENKSYRQVNSFGVHTLARCPSIFSSIAIELNVPRDEFRLFSPWGAVLKRLVQSSLISVALETMFFKSDYIKRYLHNWVVLRLCIVFTIGESLRVCSKYSN